MKKKFKNCVFNFHLRADLTVMICSNKNMEHSTIVLKSYDKWKSDTYFMY